jgi:hypothetical protein
MNAELTEEQRDEYGVELDLETKKKIMGENAAELYDIDIEAKKKAFESDDVTEEFGLADHYAGSSPTPADD